MSRVRKTLATLHWKLTLWRSEERRIHGIPVLVTNNGAHAPTADIFRALETALGLIARYRPRTLRRMQRDLARIWVHRFVVCRGVYDPRSRTCITDTSFVAQFPPEIVASTLVHEGMHARIRTVVRTWPPDGAAKEERLCRNAELRFGRALPDGHRVVSRIAPMLNNQHVELAPRIDWRAAHQRANRVRLREAPGPYWLKRAVAKAAGWGSLDQKD